jgi:predicted nucleic acid-binding protein
VWEADGQAYSPTGLAKHILEEGADRTGDIQGPLCWIDEDGRSLVEIARTLPLDGEEAGSDQAIEIWRAAETPVSSVLLYPESRAALALAERLGRLSPARGRDARAEFEALFADVGLIAAYADLLRRAGDLAETHALRGNDAVHLALAAAIADDRTVMVTADRHLRGAARNLGLATATLTN